LTRSSQEAVLGSLEEPIKQLTELHAGSRGNLWMPSEILFPAGIPRPERVRQLCEAAAKIPPALRAIYALHLLTEEALPSYFHLLAESLRLDSGFRRWIDRWTAEEDRHGRLLIRLSDLCGIIPDPVGFERWRFRYIESGFRPVWAGDAYCLIAYTALQEELTKISHGNAARLLKGVGAGVLAPLLARVASDENFHARFYRAVAKLVFERDPDGMVGALWQVIQDFEMPGLLMPQYAELSYLAVRHRTLTPADVAAVIERLAAYLGLPDITPASAETESAVRAIYARTESLREQDEMSRRSARKPRPRRFAFPFLEPFTV
jgi:acyl-[acyl-carrier-protein] desaturase